MTITVQQLADLLKGKIEGDGTIVINNLTKIEEGEAGTLTFLSNPKYTNFVYTTKASAILVDETFELEKPINATLIRVPSAYQALATLLELVNSAKPQKKGIHPKAIISETAQLGENVYVGANAVIGDNVKIGNNTKIYPNAHIDDNAIVGDDCTIYANVSIYYACQIANRCIVQAGAVIGSDGFGFAPDKEGKYNKIPQVGNVVLCDDVEVGANACIDRATMGSTVISRGVKIDNLVQIAHNVEVGEDTAIAAQTGIAGSTKVGKRCIFAGQVGVLGHATIAEGSIFGAQTGVAASVTEPGKAWQGSPHMPVMSFRKLHIINKQLPDIVRQINKMDKKINKGDEK